MKTININFDVKSIKNAIKEVKEIQSKMQKEVPQSYLKKCLEWVRLKADDYLHTLYIEPEIIDYIASSWEISINGNIGTLVNTSNKAVYLEFGVGKEAQQNPHPNSSMEGYEYNIDSGKKDYKGRWRFTLSDYQPIDLIGGYYDESIRGNKSLITTQGSPANLYLYNAMMDLISSGAYKTLWQETLAELIK